MTKLKCKQVIQGIFLGLVGIGLGSLMYNLNTEPEAISDIDNRILTEWGNEEEDFIAMVDDYLSDRIGFRSDAINLYTKLNDDIFGEMVHPQYIWGKDGYVFSHMSNETCNEEYLDLFCAYLKQAQDYCEARGVPFIFCLNPNKTTVYQEYLPTGYTYKNLVNNTLKKKLKEYGITYITNDEVLIEKHYTEQVYNKLYDAQHWNDLGCFYGSNHLLEKIAEYFPAVQQIELSDFEIYDIQQDSLPVSKFEIDETTPYIVNPKEENLEDRTEDYAALEIDENYNEKVVKINVAAENDEKENGQELPRVLMFQGSYYNALERYRLIDTSFKEYYAIHDYENALNLDYYFNVFQPEIVIFEVAEYTLNGEYFSWDTLDNKVLNPVLDVEAHKDDMKKLSDFEYEKEEEGSLVKITLSGEQVGEVERGWLVMNGKQFDFSVKEDGSVSCTVDVKNFAEEGAEVYFE